MLPYISCTNFYLFSVFFYISYCPLKLFLSLQLLADGAVIKQLMGDSYTSKDCGYSGPGIQGKVWAKQHGAVLLQVYRPTEETDI